MTKKHFIALADILKNDPAGDFSEYAVEKLADFCQLNFPCFDRSRWLGYIKGECGKNGGRIKP